MINGFAVKGYLRDNLSVASYRAPLDSVRRLVPPNSSVALASSASSTINVARGIKAVSHDDREGRDQGVKVSCNTTRSTVFLSNIGLELAFLPRQMGSRGGVGHNEYKNICTFRQLGAGGHSERTFSRVKPRAHNVGGRERPPHAL